MAKRSKYPKVKGRILRYSTYKAANPRITATENLTLHFICIFHNKAAGKIAKDQSVIISIAEKKKLTSLSSLRSHEPVVVSPHNVVIG